MVRDFYKLVYQSLWFSPRMSGNETQAQQHDCHVITVGLALRSGPSPGASRCSIKAAQRSRSKVEEEGNVWVGRGWGRMGGGGHLIALLRGCCEVEAILTMKAKQNNKLFSFLAGNSP